MLIKQRFTKYRKQNRFVGNVPNNLLLWLPRTENNLCVPLFFSLAMTTIKDQYSTCDWGLTKRISI